MWSDMYSDIYRDMYSYIYYEDTVNNTHSVTKL